MAYICPLCNGDDVFHALATCHCQICSVELAYGDNGLLTPVDAVLAEELVEAEQFVADLPAVKRVKV